MEFEYWLNDVAGTGTGEAGMMGGVVVVTSVVGAVETGDGVLLKVVGWIHPATRNNADKKYDGIVFPFITYLEFPLESESRYMFLIPEMSENTRKNQTNGPIISFKFCYK